MKMKICEICDNDFEPAVYNSKWCDDCRDDFKTSDSDKRR